MNQVKPWVAMVLIFGGLLVACGGVSEGTHKIEAATLESVDGTDISRVILTADAAERIGIATMPVRSEEVARKRQFGAEVLSRPTGAPSGPGVWIRVVLTESELGSVDLEQPARVFPLSGDELAGSADLPAQAAGPGVGDPGDPSGSIYDTITGVSPLVTGTRVLIELVVSGGERLIVPYSSVIYGEQGKTWTYTNPELLVFMRHPISIEYIDGDEAILLDGPPPGTEVVTVGSGELSGFENGIGN